MMYQICWSWQILLVVYLQCGVVRSNPDVGLQSEENLGMLDVPKKWHRFYFKSDVISGENVPLMPLSIDPDRDRRSIIVPRGEGLLKGLPHSHFKHSRHRFIPPVTDSFPGYNNSLRLRSGNRVSVKTPLRSRLAKVNHRRKYDMSRESNYINVSYNQSMRRKFKEASKRKRNKMKKKRLKKKQRRKKKNKSRNKIYGQEACQYKILKSCSKKSRILPRRVARDLTDYQKCSNRQKFLHCVEKRRNKRKCKDKTRTRGNISKLRAWINEVFQTSYSCLLNESIVR